MQGKSAQTRKKLADELNWEWCDEEAVLMMQEHPYLQFFYGFPEYTDEPPFDASLRVYFCKRLTPEILGEIDDFGWKAIFFHALFPLGLKT